jgi:hypothetical protein
MNNNCFLELEELVLGKKNKLDFKRTKTTNRDIILEHLHSIIFKDYPEACTDGEFLDSDNYILYELHINNKKSSISSIRVFDFGDKLTILRV